MGFTDSIPSVHSLKLFLNQSLPLQLFVHFPASSLLSLSVISIVSGFSYLRMLSATGGIHKYLLQANNN